MIINYYDNVLLNGYSKCSRTVLFLFFYTLFIWIQQLLGIFDGYVCVFGVICFFATEGK